MEKITKDERDFLLEIVVNEDIESPSKLQKIAREYGLNPCYKTCLKYIKMCKKEMKSSLIDVISKEVAVKSKIIFSPRNKREEFLEILKDKKKIHVSELLKELDCTPTELSDIYKYYETIGKGVMIDDEHILLGKGTVEHDVEISQLEEKEITFAVCSDFHFGSKFCQITALNEFAKVCEKQGVQHIFTCGDILTGITVFKGQHQEVYADSIQKQEQSAILNIPKGPFKWYILGGNHDYSFMKNHRYNPLKVMCAARNDFVYCGYDQSDITILPKVKLRLWHPDGGQTYNKADKLRMMGQQVVVDDHIKLLSNPNHSCVRFLFAGHLHLYVHYQIGSIFGAFAASFEDTTPFLLRKGLVSTVGGLIIRAKLDSTGQLESCSPMWLNYTQKVIQNDWKNYKHEVEQSQTN